MDLLRGQQPDDAWNVPGCGWFLSFTLHPEKDQAALVFILRRGDRDVYRVIGASRIQWSDDKLVSAEVCEGDGEAAEYLSKLAMSAPA